MALAGLSKSEKDEHCVCFAALALHDGGAEINADSIKAMVEATGNEVEAYWPMIAAKFFTSGDNCKNLIVKPGGSGGGGGGGGGGGSWGRETAASMRLRAYLLGEPISSLGPANVASRRPSGPSTMHARGRRCTRSPERRRYTEVLAIRLTSGQTPSR